MPLVSQTFDQLLDFTRTSSATFVGSNGLIQNTPASRNLLTWTQQFDNAAWGKGNTTIAANSTVAPDGTSTADTMLETTTSGTHIVNTVTYTGTYTFSVFVKAAGRNFAMVGNAGVGAVSINLTSGEISVSSGTVISFSATDAQNGWWRVSVTLTLPTALSIFVYSSQDGIFANRSYVGDPSLGIYVWGAQLEAASAASTYTRNNGGVFPPRFDYDPVTLAPKGLLTEEQRTNLLIRSEDFTTSWAATRATVASNVTTSPDGTVNADQIVEDTSNNSHFINQTVVSLTGNTTVAVSIYAKAAGRNFLALVTSDSASTFRTTYFNLSNGTIGTTAVGHTASIQSMGDGWYRCAVVTTQAATTGGFNVYPSSANVDGTSAYQGNGTSGIFLYGAQLEAGAFATSYIPTVASQVTRTADQTSIVAPNFAPWYNQSEGTFVYEYVRAANTSGVGGRVFASGVGGSNSYGVWVNQANNIEDALTIRDISGDAVSESRFIVNSTGVNKGAVAYKANDFAWASNGAAPATDNAGPVPSLSNQLRLGRAINSDSAYLNGHIRSIRYYPVRLSNTQLQALTA